MYVKKETKKKQMWQTVKNRWICMKCRRRQWHPTPVLLPRKSHGRRGLVGCSPWGRKELDTTEQLHFHFSLSCIGEGNGNPLQCSCLEKPRDGEAWWAAVYGVAQSRTRLTRLSSSSSSIVFHCMNIPHFLPLIDGHWGCFQFLAIMNSAAVTIHVQAFV